MKVFTFYSNIFILIFYLFPLTPPYVPFGTRRFNLFQHVLFDIGLIEILDLFFLTFLYLLQIEYMLFYIFGNILFLYKLYYVLILFQLPVVLMLFLFLLFSFEICTLFTGCGLYFLLRI